ncbi:hypothetical protein NEOLEDRAFT_1181163 [Neolentinus lepideus HHB14362 ss-1]|uniref:HMG box domain-containing protein n=1 Tax=Neolentinus lepideus HHB14362 ss-1 TaxID=1314782 RepID=A0A165Q9C5_9AGAM|nr:hypothetical protein NEOLEDRAFT_1181163 [Neolentinus lepideus HHB14362 ss-1]
MGRAAFGGWETSETLDLGVDHLFLPTVQDSTPPSSSSATSTPNHAALSPATSSSPPNAYSAFSSPVPTIGKPTSHARKRKPGHIPRPPNAFMIFRSDFCATRVVTEKIERDHRHISRIAGFVWNKMSDEERKPFVTKAREVKEQHAKYYPDYKYSPTCSKGKGTKRRVRRDGAEDQARCATVANLVLQGIQGDELERRLKEEETGSRIAPKNAPKTRAYHRPAVKYEPTPAPSIKYESPHFPGLEFESESSPAELDMSAFIPTEDIPELDISSPGFTPQMEAETSFLGGLLDQRAYPVMHRAVGELYLSPRQLPQTGMLWYPEGSSQAQPAFDFQQTHVDWAKLELQIPPIEPDIFQNPYPFGEPGKEMEEMEAEMQNYFNYP